MSLYKRGDIWHYDFAHGGQRYRGSTKQRRKAHAEAIVEKLKRDAALGASAHDIPTLEQAANRWFTARHADKKSAKTTALRLEIMLRLMGPDTLVNAIGAREVEDAIQRRRLEPTRQSAKSKEPRAPSNATVNRDLIDSTLRPILRYAAEILEAPVKPIPWKALKLAEPKGRERSFTAEEQSDWRRNLPPWHRPVFDFYRRYGLRLDEAFFPPSAFDPVTATVRIRERKNGQPHTIRLLPEDAAQMAARVGRATAAKLSTVWFREMKSGELRAIHWRGYQSASQTALKRAGIEDARPTHDLRHHAATTMLRATGNLAAVKKLLGHESIQSTMRYAHADDEDVLNALRHTYGTKAEAEPEKLRGINRQGAKRSGT